MANRHLRRIEAAFFGFNLVEHGTWVSVLVYANDATEPASVGLVALAQLVPAAIFAPLAAGLGDRFPRNRVLVGGHALMSIAAFAVWASMVSNAPPPVVYAFAIALAASITLPRPVQAAITPTYAETPEQLTAANGVNTIFEGLGLLAGPFAAGILMAIGSPALVFLSAGVVAAASALLVANIGLRRPSASGVSEDSHEGPSMLHGARAIAADRDQLLILVVLAGRFVILGAFDVLLVLVATEALGLDGSTAGFLMAAVGLGGLLGGALTVVLIGRRGLASWILAGAVAAGASMAFVAVAPGLALLLPVLALGGIGLSCLDVAGRTLLQRIGRTEVLAEVFGLVEGFSMLGLAFGSIATSVLFASVGLTNAIALTAVFLPVVGIAAWWRLRTTETRVAVPLEQIQLLRGLSIFGLVPAPAIEAAAQRLVRLTMPQGTTVFAEGDLGDRFYIVARGSVEVRQHGALVRTLGPGDGFGEIALLRDVARTATIVAATDADLWSLDRDGFLLAITGSPQAVTEARSRAEGMLAEDRTRG